METSARLGLAKELSPKTRLPSLDGWRAVSILLVLGSHYKLAPGFPQTWDPVFKWMFNGNLGVRFFFVISGFLITYLLFEEHEKTGRVDLRNFYLRRALRIFPVYFTYLLVVFLFEVATGTHSSGKTWLGNLTFTTNFVPHAATVTEHLWSLGVEEQFYLLWPFTLCLIGCAGRGRRLACVLGMAIVVAPVCRVVSYTGIAPVLFKPLFYGYSFLNYFDSLAMGCLTALVLKEKRDWSLAVLGRLKWTVTVPALAFILTPYVLSNFFLAGAFTVPLGPTLQAAGFSILLLRSILFPGDFKMLNWPALRTVGVLSYSIYIWQQLFWSGTQTFGARPAWYLSFPAWPVAVLVVAVTSYCCLETPLMNLRSKLRDHPRSGRDAQAPGRPGKD